VKLKEEFPPKIAASRRKQDVREDVAWKKGRMGKENEEKEHWWDRNGWKGLVDGRGTYMEKSKEEKERRMGIWGLVLGDTSLG
jgi:hypothetical protein